MSKFEIGKIYGSNNNLLIIDKINTKRTMYKVQCQICKEDHELHGEATYTISGDYFNNGKLPCGCSKSKKWTKEQWIILLTRKAKENNHIFHGFVNDVDKVDADSKLDIECLNCGDRYKTGTVSNYYNNRGCPSCAINSRAYKRSTKDDEWIKRFRETELFTEDKFSFERLNPTGRLWKVFCKECNLNFTSDRSNLVAGKIPCNCGTGGGYDISKTGYFYVLDIEMLGQRFVKFGISNFPKRRIQNHIRTLEYFGGVINNQTIFKGEGGLVLMIESELKRNLNIDNKLMDGFKRECCKFEDKNKVLDALHNLEIVVKPLKI